MQPGDRIYYNHSDKNGLTQKYPAIVLSSTDTEVELRIGRLNVITQKIETAVFSVSREAVSRRNSKCNYEEELLGDEIPGE